MTLFDVNAICLDPTTGDIVAPPRIERIDTEENILFRGCSGPWEVEDQYHAFWNRLNDSWETDPPQREKVLVLSVTEVAA